MARYTVINKGELKKAGQYLKQILTVSKPDGSEVECFTWVNDESAAAGINVGDVLEGELSYKDSPNPKYKGEWKLGKWEKVGSGAAAVNSPAPVQTSGKFTLDGKDERIARGNACNAVCFCAPGSKCLQILCYFDGGPSLAVRAFFTITAFSSVFFFR